MVIVGLPPPQRVDRAASRSCRRISVTLALGPRVDEGALRELPIVPDAQVRGTDLTVARTAVVVPQAARGQLSLAMSWPRLAEALAAGT